MMSLLRGLMMIVDAGYGHEYLLGLRVLVVMPGSQVPVLDRR
jgi:hypothetical protein